MDQFKSIFEIKIVGGGFLDEAPIVRDPASFLSEFTKNHNEFMAQKEEEFSAMMEGVGDLSLDSQPSQAE